MMPRDVAYTIYNGLSKVPAFDPGLDNNDPPVTVAEFRALLAGADGIIICTPEYAFGVPGALKNALDWTVSSGSFSGKPTLLITASTGGENAHEAMMKILGAIDAKLYPETSLLIQFVRSKMDAEGNIIEPATAQKLTEVFNAFMAGLADKLILSVVESDRIQLETARLQLKSASPCDLSTANLTISSTLEQALMNGDMLSKFISKNNYRLCKKKERSRSIPRTFSRSLRNFYTPITRYFCASWYPTRLMLHKKLNA